jgi:hypothetical protein
LADLVFEAMLKDMRVLITLVTTISVGALLAFDNPKGFRSISNSVAVKGEQLWSDKELRIDGLRLLSRSEIEKLLPLQRSVAWWHLNASEVEAKLNQNAWVESATLESCPESWASRWGCFLLQVKERQPMFIGSFDGKPWVIDRDGRSLVPQSDLAGRGFSGQLIEVKGAANSSSPDLVRAQLSAASRLCDTVAKEVGRPIRALEFLGQGDFSVSFEGLPFPVVFAAGKDAKVPLAEQGVRCAALLRQLGTRFSDVAKIDLAFDRVGIVQFKLVGERGINNS